MWLHQLFEKIVAPSQFSSHLLLKIVQTVKVVLFVKVWKLVSVLALVKYLYIW